MDPERVMEDSAEIVAMAGKGNGGGSAKPKPKPAQVHVPDGKGRYPAPRYPTRGNVSRTRRD